MSGETELNRLLASMQPVLAPEIFVFCTLSAEHDLQWLSPRLIFDEAEGKTLILEQSQADEAGLKAEFPCRMITLTVHSALEVVGFLATIIPALAEEGMGVNPVAGFYHDHLFVPADRASDALACLQRLADTARASAG